MPDPLDLYSFQRGLCLQQGPFLFYALPNIICKFGVISIDYIIQRGSKTVDFPGASLFG